MPLLRRQPFIKQKIPSDLKPDEEVFHCKLTNEIFRDYEEFFERIILCNSLVWTCSITGRPGLTYQEAVEAEEKARKQLSSFPDFLQKPILFLATLTHRSRLNDLNDDVFVYSRDRYFIGEIVEVNLKGGERKPCRVLRIVPPVGVPASPAVPTKNGSPEKPIEIDSSDDDVVCLEPKSPKTPGAAKSPLKDLEKTKAMGADPTQYQYVVQETRKAAQMYTVKANQINRKRGLLTRDKCKLYLKQHCDSEGDGVWKVKERYMKRYKLAEAKFQNYFTGPSPQFAVSQVKKKPLKKTGNKAEDDLIKRAKQEMKDKKKQRKGVDKEEKSKLKAEKIRQKIEEAEKRKKLSPEEMAALREKFKQEKDAAKQAKREEMKKQMEEEKQKRKEEREKEKEHKKEEKRQREEIMKEWSRPRDDMECDDLKPMPPPTAIETKISADLFGDVLMVLEFLNSFDSLFDLHAEFPEGIKLDKLIQALRETEMSGLFSDLLKFLLGAVFSLQEEEEEEEDNEDGNANVKWSLTHSQSTTYKDHVQRATEASHLSHRIYGSSVTKLPLDTYTMTEILRLHFSSGGAKVSDANSKFRYQQRGGYTSLDDAGLEFAITEPRLLDALRAGNVYDLEPENKLKLLNALIHELLTFVACRDIIEDNSENLRAGRHELRQIQMSEQRRERDEQTFWYKKRLEEKAKEREAEAERKEKRKKEREDRLKLDELIKKEKTEGVSNEEKAELVRLEKECRKVEERRAAALKTEANPEKEGEIEPKPEERRSSNRIKIIEEVKAAADKVPERKSSRQKEAKDKEISFEDIPVEHIDWDKVTPEEKQRWKDKYLAKEREIAASVTEYQRGFALYPLGRDRLFRRYWMFQSVPGLFVENLEEHITPECLQPVDQKSNSHPFHGGYLPTTTPTDSPKSEEKSTSSDKENDGENMASPTMPKVAKNLLASMNAANNENMEIDLTEEESEEKTIQGPIKPSAQVRWAFYNSPEELDMLIESLNPRGYREGPLKQSLLENKKSLIYSLDQCPSKMLLLTTEEAREVSEKKIKYQNVKTRGNRTTQGAVTNASAQEFMELNLRESLLDLEERMFFGTLGSIKVKDRNVWRNAIEIGNYSKQCDQLSWSGMTEQQIATEKAENVLSNEKLEESVEMKDISQEEQASNGPLKMEVDQETDGNEEDQDKCPVVRDLAKALLQIEQGVEGRYLNKPLGEEEPSKKSKQKGGKATKKKDKKNENDAEPNDGENDHDKSDLESVKSALEYWEQSLMQCTSLPQIFLHLNMLDRSIAWTKSSLHARCRLCRRKGDGEKMLLCDGCDRGHHMYCLKPAVKKVPEGDWYCPDCKPKDLVRTPRKARRKSFMEQSEDEDEPEDKDSSDLEDAEEEEEEESDDGVAELASTDEEDNDEEVEDNDQGDEDDDSDDDDDDEDDSDEESDDEDDDEPPKIRMKGLLGGLKKKRGSGRSTPNSVRSVGRSPRDSPRDSPVPFGGRNSRSGKKSLEMARLSLEKGSSSRSSSKSRSNSKSRKSMETSRKSVETSRKSMETSKKSGETSRKSMETSRKSVETSRKSMETSRKSVESGKRSASKSRNSLETSRPSSRTGKRRASDVDDDSPPNKKAATTKSRGNDEANQMKTVTGLVNDLMSRDDAWPFLKPVTRRQAPDYFDIIKKPMDFSTIKSRINKFEYSGPLEILDDMRLIFANCIQYNINSAPEYASGQKLAKLLEKKIKELKLDKLNNNSPSSSTKGRARRH